MAQVYTVTASTSIVLISTLQSPNTIVLLSSISYPGHIVGIRDITGDPSITARPIVVSTTGGVRFYDYSFSTLINQPNGYLSLSSKDPTTWQLLNTQANQNSLSNAYLTDLSSTYAYITLVSSVQEYVSSFTAAQVFVTRSIFLEGNTQITGSISVRGNVDIFSTLNVSDDMNISSGLLVGGNTFIPSSLFVQGGLQVGGTLSTLQNAILTQNLVLGGELKAQGALLDKNLNVQTLDAETLAVGGSARIAGDARVVSNMTAEQLWIQKGAIVQSNITIQSNTSMQGNLQIENDTYMSTLASRSSIAVGGCIETKNLLSVQGSVSTIDTIQVVGSTFVSSNTQVQSDLFIYGSFIGSSLTVAGNVDFFNTHATDSLFLRNNLNLVLSGTVNTENLRIQGNLGVGVFLYGNKAVVQGNVSSINTAFVGGIVSSQGTLETGNSLTVGQNAFVSKALNITKSVSTTYFSSGYDLYVSQNLFVGGTVSTSNLAAPISLSISTLALKGSLNVQSEGRIPFLDTTRFPDSLIVGTQTGNEGQSLQVQGNALIQSTIDQVSYFNTDSKIYNIQTLQVSSIRMPNMLSSILVGSPATIRPFIDTTGYVVVGENIALPGEQQIWYSKDLSNWLPAETPFTVGTYSKVATNGLGFWVAAGNSTSDSNDTLLWSEDGVRWNKSQQAYFPAIAYDVVYGFDTSGAGVWVAAGDGTSNLVFSTDGKRWDNASYGTFDRAALAVAYTNGSFFAVGNNGVSGDFPYLYSVDGRHWSTIVNPAGYTAPFLGTAVGFTDQTPYPDFRIVGGDPSGPPNNTLTSIDGGSTFDYVPVPPLNIRRAFVYAGEKWVSAGCNQPSQTGGISVSLDPFAQVWTDVSDGYVNGLTGSYNDIIFDSNTGLFIAAGSMASPTDKVLAISPTALTGWSTLSIRYGGSFLAKANGLAVGPIKYPIQKSFATINVPTTISSVFSTVSLQASTIRASSFQGSFFGEGSALSNIEAFASTLLLSTMTNTTTRTRIISTIENPENRIFTTEANVQNNVFIGNRFELSTNNVWIAGGLDLTLSNILQYGESGRDWFASGNTFQISCKGVSGNGRPLYGETLFVAVGRDTRTVYTIQWSPNGSNWYPIVSGGFSNALIGTIKSGNNVVFNRFVNAPTGRWVACGEDLGSNTILYSDNGIDWFPANNCFSTTTLKVATLSTMAGYTCYTNVDGRSFFKYSADGINWSDSAIQTGFDTSVATIGNGMWTRVPQLETYIAFTENGRILQGGGTPIPGSSWTYQANYSLPVPSNVIYESPVWVTVGRNIIAYTSSPTTNWRSTITTFPLEVQFQGITYNRVLNRWAAGGQATTTSNTLWYSDNLRTWTRATSGGFNTTTLARGAGYSVIPYFSNVLAAGTAAYEVNTNLAPRILLGDSNGFSLNLTQSNAATVFSTQVQAIAYNQSIDGFYTLVGVGDGLTPQKTIARAVSTSSNVFQWLPAVTGGFKTGYDVTYFDRTSNTALKKWWAVGDFVGSTNTTAAINAIQASEDGLNWFGSNKAFDTSIYALYGGGRGIFTFQSSNFPDIWNICAVGKGTPQNPANVVSYTEWWFNNRINGFFGGGGASQRFNVQGNAITALQWSSGYVQIQWVAVGQDTRREYTIQIGDQNPGGGTINSPTSPNWSPIDSGGFDVAGHGIVYATLPGFVNMFVAVGEDTDPSKTIQVLVNPDFFGSVFRFSNTGVTGYFTKAGYSVTYNSTVSTFYAVGEDLSGIATRTIKYSKDGFTWSNVDPVQAALNNLFTSEQILGSANTLYSQSVLSPEIYPTIELSNLVFYNNQFQRAYPNPTVRLQSTFMIMQETLSVNLNNQVFIASNAPYVDLSNRSTSLTVGGIIVASTIIFTKATGATLTTDTFVRQLIASSITNYESFTVESLETPSLTIQKRPALNNTVRTDFATFSINTSTVQSRVVNINNTMFVSADLRQNDFVGIRVSTTQIPGPDFIVNGTVAMSSLTTAGFLTSSTLQLSTSQEIYFSSAYLKITNNKFRTAADTRNYIYIEPSSMTFNSVLTANISSQKVGLYTENPIFDFDVRRNGVLDIMSTQALVSRMLFFTLQSL